MSEQQPVPAKSAVIEQAPKPTTAAYMYGLSLLFVAVLYAIYRGAGVDIEADKFLKVNISSTVEATKAAQKAKPEGAPQPVTSSETTELDKSLQLNGVTYADISMLLKGTSTTLPKAKILWVDDHPSNNQYQRLAFAGLGIYCDEYTNNYDARVAARMVHYDIIISDVDRDKEPENGIDLLKELRDEEGYTSTPFFYYTIRNEVDVTKLAAEKGVSVFSSTVTNDPAVLLKRVLATLPKTPDAPRTFWQRIRDRLFPYHV